jgi:hypothetical protein
MAESERLISVIFSSDFMTLVFTAEDIDID